MNFNYNQKEVLERELVNQSHLNNSEFAGFLLEKYQNIFKNYTHSTLRKYIGMIRNKEEEFFDTEIEYDIPETYYTDPSVLMLDGSVGVMNDIHIPFHDRVALRIAIDKLHELNPKYLLLNGDIIDFYPLSRFSRNPNFRDLNKEISLANKFLDYLQSNFTNIVFKEGNHENRLIKYVADKAPELGNLEGITLEGLLHLKQRGIKFVDNRGHVKLGKLRIIHGDEINNGGTINVARVKILRTMDNIMFGHHHVTQDYLHKRFSSSTIGAWSVGCLCGLYPEYARFNNWNHGFAFVELFDNGDFEVKNFKIINGRVL